MHVLFCYLHVEQYLEPTSSSRLKTQSPDPKSECEVTRRAHTLNLIRKDSRRQQITTTTVAKAMAWAFGKRRPNLLHLLLWVTIVDKII